MGAQEEFKTYLQSGLLQLKRSHIEDIEDWVRRRTDAAAGLRLPSLAKLSDRDLRWLLAAIDNTGT